MRVPGEFAAHPEVGLKGQTAQAEANNRNPGSLLHRLSYVCLLAGNQRMEAQCSIQTVSGLFWALSEMRNMDMDHLLACGRVLAFPKDC